MATPTTYYRPKTLEDAYERSQQPGAIALAGGALTLGTLDLPYETVIDVQDVPELRAIDMGEGGASFGAACTLQQVLEWERLPNAIRRALTRAVPLNIRSGTSILESLRPPYNPMLRDWLAAIAAHDIGVRHFAPGEERWTNFSTMIIEPDAYQQDFLVGIHIPAIPAGEALGSAFVARTPADNAIVNAATYVYLNEGRRVESVFTAICGASREPVVMLTLDTLIGSPFDEANIASAVKIVPTRVEPVGDYLGSAEYRREMARVVVQRALLDCLEQLPPV